MKNWLGPIILGLFGVIILCGLGIWQLERLTWKEGLIAELDAQMTAPPMRIEDVDLDNLEALHGTPVTMRGVFLDEQTDLLSGNENGAGYRRIVPFETNNMVVLAELGFLSEAQRGAVMVLPEGEVELEGHIDVPENRDGQYDARLNVWVGNNPEGMAKQLGALPIMVALSRSPIEELEDTPMMIDLPNNHLQYAITWFSLAAVWAAMAFYWGYRRNKDEG